ncbi:MFS transporter [Halorussus salinisoli]|uniref:MFS transporter n=1 Tax=Halorussus salinisoli TaxID=2558242 RepID=UPI0010C18ADC|nr:MFS transporter [Halorussus salinisoli]
MSIISPGAEYLITQTDWQTAYGVICVFLVSALLVATLLIRDPPTHETNTGHPTHTSSSPSTGEAITTLASSLSFQLLFLRWILIYTTLYVVFLNLPVYTADLGLTTQVGAVALGVIGATSVLSRLTVGFAADHLGRTTMFTLSSALMGVSTLFFPFVETAGVFYLIAMCYGLGYGGNGALLSPLMADFYGTANINTVFGLISMSFAISGLFTPYLAGNIYDLTGTYTVPFLLSGVLAIGGAGLIATAKRTATT